MTYVANTPLSSDSPGILPSQVSTNFGRLKTLLGADHQFNDSALANDGWHNLIHMTEQAPTGALANTGRLFAKNDGSATQLFYMDSAGVEYQITPESAVSPTLVIGSSNMGVGATITIFANPSYNYSGTATAFIQGTATGFSANLAKSGSTGQSYGFTNSIVVPGLGLLLLYDGSGNLTLQNATGFVQNVSWVVTVNRATP